MKRGSLGICKLPLGPWSHCDISLGNTVKCFWQMSKHQVFLNLKWFRGLPPPSLACRELVSKVRAWRWPCLTPQLTFLVLECSWMSRGGLAVTQKEGWPPYRALWCCVPHLPKAESGISILYTPGPALGCPQLGDVRGPRILKSLRS